VLDVKGVNMLSFSEEMSLLIEILRIVIIEIQKTKKKVNHQIANNKLNQNIKLLFVPPQWIQNLFERILLVSMEIKR
jgi:hypothetical protein